jgi:hypothetical protein
LHEIAAKRTLNAMWRAGILLGLAATVAIAACLPGSGPPLNPYVDDAGSPPPTGLGPLDAGARSDVDLGDPFAIIGLTPSHGPFSGGARTTLAGRGFPSKLRVWIGGTEVRSADIVASDPTRAAIVAPPGNPGPADVKIRDDNTAQERVLLAGYFYDSFVVEPQSGATSGGTRIALTGSGTHWGAATTIAIDGKPCGTVQVSDATHAQCTTPPDTPGSKDIVVTDDAGNVAQARDAYTYGDSNDGYRGGLSGGALNGQLKVLIFDAWAGVAIPGAHAIAGAPLGSAVVGAADASGVVALSDSRLKSAVTVTVVAKCHQPMSFVNVPVDTVTAYLTPTLDPACADGDPPSSGAYGGVDQGQISGELLWSGAAEGHRAGWNNVPMPVRTTERRAAYVYLADWSPLDGFWLPNADQAVTPSSAGVNGYAYVLGASPGNVTVYALAGIEDRSFSPPHFTAYAMGAVRGVGVQPSTKITNVDIPMTTLLDHQVTLAPSPPPWSATGPDRLYGQLAVTLGQNAFAILPTGTTTWPLPVTGNVAFPGVPALDGSLTGELYTITAAAVTGPNLQNPSSVVSRIQTNNANDPIAVNGFLAVPSLIQPSTGAWSGTHVEVGMNGGFDLLKLEIMSGGGLVEWDIVAPGGVTSFDLPDLSLLPGNVGMWRGTIYTTVYVARINAFDYGKLRWGNLGSSTWNAYAINAKTGSY